MRHGRRCCERKRTTAEGRLRRFGRGPVNAGSWHGLRPPPERQPSRVQRTYQRAARSCFVQDVVHSEHFRVVTPYGDRQGHSPSPTLGLEGCLEHPPTRLSSRSVAKIRRSKHNGENYHSLIPPAASRACWCSYSRWFWCMSSGLATGRAVGS